MTSLAAPRLRRTAFTAVLVAALLATGFVVGLVLQMRAQDAAEIGTIKTSYSFDVTDTAKVMDYADQAFVGEVVGVARTEEARSATVWKVRVVDAVKGTPGNVVLVRQLGYVDKNDKAHVAEDQPLLRVGSRQLLVTTRTPVGGELTLIGGPRASVPIKSSTDQRRVIDEYTAAAR